MAQTNINLSVGKNNFSKSKIHNNHKKESRNCMLSSSFCRITCEKGGTQKEIVWHWGVIPPVSKAGFTNVALSLWHTKKCLLVNETHYFCSNYCWKTLLDLKSATRNSGSWRERLQHGESLSSTYAKNVCTKFYKTQQTFFWVS